MKLAYVASEFYPPIGGAGIYSVNLVRELAKYDDMNIHVFTPQRGSMLKYEVERKFGGRVNVHFFGKANDDFIYNFFFQLRMFRKLPVYQKLFDFDLIHVANLVNMPDIWLKCFSLFGADDLKIPVITTAHTTIQSQVGGFLKNTKNFFSLSSSERWSLIVYPYILALQSIYLHKTNHLITVSSEFARRLDEDWHYHKPVEVIPNGIDLDIFNYDAIQDPYEAFPQLIGKGRVVLFAGRLVAIKGLKLLVESISGLLDTDAHFVFAGRGSIDILKRDLEAFNIPKERYTILGFVPNDQLPSLYKLSTLFVLPSYGENMPISLLEAMAMKTACVSTDVGAVKEIFGGSGGSIIPVGDSVCLEKEIRYLLCNEDIRKQLAMSGYEIVVTNFSAVTMAARHRRYYDEVLSNV